MLLLGIIVFSMMACCNKAAESSEQDGACEKQECCKKDSGKCCQDTIKADTSLVEVATEAESSQD